MCDGVRSRAYTLMPRAYTPVSRVTSGHITSVSSGATPDITGVAHVMGPHHPWTHPCRVRTHRCRACTHPCRDDDDVTSSAYRVVSHRMWDDLAQEENTCVTRSGDTPSRA